ncbi:MAG: DUF1178 family protein [Deltaproteobacteria bacterium]|nr:DUF1178 family protein [Deltaproteobacteria bacterium]MBW2071964.1 DUF1178 family protein [Deltaproteobacteria bacterium]
MIVYDLQCGNGHCFEGWFDNLRSFENQRAAGQIVCPVCDDINVEVVPAAVAVKRATASSSPRERRKKAWLEVCCYVRDNFEDVGHNFAKEALKIHCGVVEKRNIRGVSTESEEAMLKKEGVPFVKIPMPEQSDN